LAGALVAPLISVDPYMGLGFLVPAFLSILVGGSASLGGVLVGTAVVGGADSLLGQWLSPVATQIAVFVVAILAIRARPTGLVRARGGDKGVTS
jgi:branched-chain amino acid transport system permease protein/urea transport system permease protein